MFVWDDYIEDFVWDPDVVEDDDSFLAHYGMPRRSGRYPWGSGKDPYQRGDDLASRVKRMKEQGISEKDICKALGYKSTTELRREVTAAVRARRMYQISQARSLRDQGYSATYIAQHMSTKDHVVNESTVRGWLKDSASDSLDTVTRIADHLKTQVDKHGMIDIGEGSEHYLRVTAGKLDEAVYMLKQQGYEVLGGRVEQATNRGNFTTIKVLAAHGTPHKEIYDHPEKIAPISDEVAIDGGKDFKPRFHYPASFDSNRLQIRYAEEGGTDRDGLIELRRGVDDISLDKSTYAQVRILVDGTHYLKGMAVYSDDLPEGVDIRFNTNKSVGTPALGPKDHTVLKPIDKTDPNNPFGALIKEDGGQRWYTDDNGELKLSVINKKSEEGDWGSWGDSLPAQFLSKQPKKLIAAQLKETMAQKQDQFDEIMSLENATVRKKMLEDFASECDSAAVHLKAAALPRQAFQVILPVPELKDNEVYAPQFEPGEKVALVRYPHGGTFEIPILTVTNKSPASEKMIGSTALDAVCINSKVAGILSGADFDGDTVMVIPTGGKVSIQNHKPLEGLKGFEPKEKYAYHEGMKTMSKGSVQKEMGQITNLITDMTIKGATEDELAAAVRHSMVIIDAYKHRLDYKQSEKDNNILALKEKYQGVYDENGKLHTPSATLLSRAKSQVSVPRPQGSAHTDPETGEKVYYYPKDNTVTFTEKKKDGTIKTVTKPRMMESTQMAEAKDARDLVSKERTPQELLYADYANFLKAMGNQARLEVLNTKAAPYSKEAAQEYATEVRELKSELTKALMNAPRERQAQLIAAGEVKALKEANPELNDKSNKKQLKKISQQALTRARTAVGASRHKINISDRQWQAIQKGAINDTTFRKILRFADPDRVRDLSMPKGTRTYTTAQTNRVKSLAAYGYTANEIAKNTGIPISTINEWLHPKN